MQNSKAIISILILSLLLMTGRLFAQFAGGSGTSADPYQITTPTELNNVRNYLGHTNSELSFKLMNDIDLTDYLSNGGAGYSLWGGDGWMPIGSTTTAFYGKFDGNGKKIVGLRINRLGTDWVGLFSTTTTITQIKNMKLENVNITGDNLVGGIAGFLIGNIENCYVDGAVNGNTNVGGIGGFYSGFIKKCYSAANITGIEHVGGIAGYHDPYVFDSVIEDSYSFGTISGTSYVGGITGFNLVNVKNCYSIANVSGNNSVGGLVGSNGYVIENCYSAGSVSGSVGIGGLVGTGAQFPINSFWDIETSGQTTSSGSNPNSGKTTAQMKTQSTFTNWDFVNETTNGTDDYWKIDNSINNGYPSLSWQIGSSSIEVEKTPRPTQLFNNYPNPFNPNTSIKFYVKASEKVALMIYDAKGEFVKELINSNLKLGYHTINFDGSNLNSGVYFYKLQTASTQIVNKMILIK